MRRYGSHCPRSFHLWPPQHLIVAQMTRTVWSESLSISSSGSISSRIQQCRCPSHFLQEEKTKEELTGDSCKTVDEKNSRSHFKTLTFTTETGSSTCNKSRCFNAELQCRLFLPFTQCGGYSFISLSHLPHLWLEASSHSADLVLFGPRWPLAVGGGIKIGRDGRIVRKAGLLCGHGWSDQQAEKALNKH